MMSSLSTTSLLPLLLLSLLWAVLSVDASFQTLPLPILMSGPQCFAFNSTGKGFYTGVSGGTILKYTPEKGFVIFACTHHKIIASSFNFIYSMRKYVVRDFNIV